MPSLPFLKSKKRAEININLVPKDPFFDTILGKTLRWALTAGRYIVIFTELVVILSFAGRFVLDRRVTNLNDAIDQKSSIIDSYGDLENQVRLIQKKTEQYQQIEQNSNITNVFPALAEITPRGIRLEELRISPTSIVMTGNTSSQPTLNVLINNLQLSKNFTNVVVDKIESDDDETFGFNFVIKANTKEEVQLIPSESK